MSDTKDDLLAAGVRLYGSLSGDLLRGLTAGTVAQEAGYHRQTFYRHWDTQAEYVQELIRWLLAPEHAPVADGAVQLPQRRREQMDMATFVHDLASYDFARVIESPMASMRVGLLMMQELSGGPLRELTQEFYDETMGSLADAYDALLEQWDRELVPGVTSKMLARMIQAQVLGLVVQAKAATDDPSGGEVLALSVRTLLESLTRPRGHGD